MPYITSPWLPYFIIKVCAFLLLHPFHAPHFGKPPIYFLYRWVWFCLGDFFKIPHINEIIYRYLTLFVWLISLTIMPSMFIHVINDRVSHGWLIFHCVHIYTISPWLFIQVLKFVSKCLLLWKYWNKQGSAYIF